MSQPKRVVRWDVIPIEGEDDDVIHRQSAEGMFVHYADYAALAADKEAETKAVFDAIRLITQLRDENERLRKAGDGLMFEGETMAHEVSWNPAPWDRVVAAWVAAKEGRDAK